jgi:hypothetical protein
VLANAATDYHKAFALDLDVPISGAGAIAFVKNGAPSPLPLKRIGKPPGAAHPRGERWEIGPLQQPPEEPEVYTVTVTFGTAPDLVPRPFQLTVNPLIRLVNHTAGAPFEARKTAPLILDVNGGANPSRVEHPGLPAGTTVTLQARQVTVTVATPPAADTDVVITVIDADDRRGRRKVRIKRV